ncbi:hypothetical protein [Riemerella anatipestifer]|uniref:hypothetical protein n=1 Tax=Riemerella anatipestifer TaxID=34085 RepID=UPI0021F8A652|nr:hypothetical protein [Riemerella anatipestifer]MCW0485632.1 hypothetical protein [Riemerella anatipestifer]
MKSKRILNILVILIGLFITFRLINPSLSKNIQILDCKTEYKMSIFEREYEDFRYHNAKMEIAKCLCEKYIQTKNNTYKNETEKIINEFELHESVSHKTIEEICIKRNEIFSDWYYE